MVVLCYMMVCVKEDVAQIEELVETLNRQSTFAFSRARLRLKFASRPTTCIDRRPKSTVHTICIP